MRLGISAIVPVYNEEDNIEKAVQNLDRFLRKEDVDYEIIIVDSDSKDNTALLSRKLAKRFKRVKYIRQKERKGFGNGLKEGYENCKFEYTWFIDADLPYDLINLRKSYPYLNEYDAVIGYKTGSRENLFRKIMSTCYNHLMRFLFKFKYKDINYSYKIIKKSVVKKLDLKSDGWFITPEILIKLHKKGFKIKEVHVPFRPRLLGKSKVSNYPKTILYFLKEIYKFKKIYP